MDIFFGDGEGPFIPEFDPDWFLEDEANTENQSEDPTDKTPEYKVQKANPVESKVPLSSRHGEGRKGKPFERWWLDVLAGRKKITDPLEYTEEEIDAILEVELKDDIERF